MRRPKPDNRPDWRDPNMPCGVQTKSEGSTYWAPERVSKVAKVRMEMCPEPSWRNDPTYNLRKPKS